jgi:hypothetical protein
VFAAIAIGVAKFACCQPVAVSPPNVTVPSSVPVADHRWPTCVPVFPDPL